jgi:aminoglycoside 6-adenylyltransferase
MDILLFARDPQKYLDSAEWLSRFGEIKSSFAILTAGGDPERLTLFDGGWQVDVVVHPFETLERVAAQGIVPENFLRGVKVLVDKDDLSSRILPVSFTAPKSHPVEREHFAAECQMFWFLAIYMAKQILRDDLWVAKARDADMKALLLHMLEWREKAVHGASCDTWHAGRFLREWVSPEVYAELRKAFGRFDRVESWNALINTCDLYRSLSREVAVRMGFDANEALSDFATAWIGRHTVVIAGADARGSRP